MLKPCAATSSLFEHFTQESTKQLICHNIVSELDAMAQAQEQSSLRVADLGLTTLHQPLDEHSVTADLVFVHGLQGHPQRTWQPSVTSQHHTSSLNPFKRWKPQQKAKEEASLFWPADLIPQDCPTLRVLTYGYYSKIIRGYASGASKEGIFDHGNSFLNALSFERTNLSNRPIIFVAHSLGGLLVQQALVEARKQTNNSRLHDIYVSAHAVMFFGTPRRGTDVASWGLMAGRLAKAAQLDVNDSILRDLEPASGSSKLRELMRDFHDVLQDPRQQGRLQLHYFQEELGMTGLKALGSQVIPLSFTCDISETKADLFSCFRLCQSTLPLTSPRNMALTPYMPTIWICASLQAEPTMDTGYSKTS